MSTPKQWPGRVEKMSVGDWVWTVFMSFVMLGIIYAIVWAFTVTLPPRVSSGQTCSAWVPECALHKGLTECRVDARLLGCPEGSIP